ncbi:MAG: response regulator [Thermoplasmata archaeon]|nr:response regulator [Thermoplasmata archaeon]
MNGLSLNETNAFREIPHLKALSMWAENLIRARKPEEAYRRESLGILGEASGADRVYLFTNFWKDGELYMSQVSEWVREGIEPQIDNPLLKALPYSEVPFWRENLENGRIIWGDVDTFPEPERGILKEQGIKNILVIPLHPERQFYGFIGFDYCGKRKAEEEEVYFLKTAAIELEEWITKYRGEKEKIALWDAINLMDDPVLLVDWDGTIKFANSAFLNLTGYTLTELVGKKTPFLSTDREGRVFYQNMMRHLRSGNRWSGVLRLKGSDGALKDMRASITPIGSGGEKLQYLAVFWDEMDRMKLERMIEQQKFESIGVLASGLAHDFNNYLQGISGLVELMLRAKSEEERERYLSMLWSILESARGFAEKVRDLATGYVGKPVNVDMKKIIIDTINLVKSNIPPNIEVDVKLPEKGLTVYADPGSLQQVFINLILNASEAIGERKKGLIEIKGEEVYLSGDEAKMYFLPKDGHYAHITVKDNGCGIPDRIKKKVFDPFFTTKTRGKKKGTGLGLSMSRGIVQYYGGEITFYSEEGVGTLFHVYLPLQVETPTPLRKKVAKVGERKGGGRILVVEDEEVQREVLGEYLGSRGFTISLAEGGRKGLKLLKNERFDCIILDFLLGDMTGEDFIKSMSIMGVSTPVIITSGFSEDRTGRLKRDPLVKSIIQKPYPLDLLLEQIDLVLKGAL